MNKVVVVGSINIDLVVSTEHLPRVGETILGRDINYFIGGKGANQAVAAARTEAEVSLIGAVGGDTFGEKALQHITSEKISVAHTEVLPNIFTGLAAVFHLPVDNAIVVTPGANGLLTEEKVQSSIEKLGEMDVLLTQLETPVNVVKKALQSAKKVGATTILNPAPFNKECVELLDWVDLITPNETEFEGMTGKRLQTEEELEAEMLEWSSRFATRLIVTRGHQGTSYVDHNKVVTVPVISVDVQDTTGAGDTFNGILAALLSRGEEWNRAIQTAGIGASLSVQKQGAQTGMPSLQEIDKYLS